MFERDKELGVERALGMKLSQIFILFITEVTSILLFGMIIGLIIGVWLVQIIMEIILGLLQWTILPLIIVYPLELITLTCLLIIALSCIGAGLTAFLATRRNISNVLKVG